MGAVVYHIEADVGGNIELPIAVQESDGEAADLTGYTGQMKIKSSHNSDATTLATATVTINTATGVVTALIQGGDLAGATWRTGVYDLKIINGADADDVEYIARGNVRLRPTVT